MESGEHMPNKKKFVEELFRVTAPGGRIIIVTWCHRWVQHKIGEWILWEEEMWGYGDECIELLVHYLLFLSCNHSLIDSFTDFKSG